MPAMQEATHIQQRRKCGRARETKQRERVGHIRNRESESECGRTLRPSQRLTLGGRRSCWGVGAVWASKQSKHAQAAPTLTWPPWPCTRPVKASFRGSEDETWRTTLLQMQTAAQGFPATRDEGASYKTCGGRSISSRCARDRGEHPLPERNA
eukprot:4896257-Pleurochrysis_carterae.AAC.1